MSNENKTDKSLGKYSSLAKNTVLFSISNIGSKFISFFLVPLYTFVLTTEEYGKVDLVTTIASLLIPVLTLNIKDAVLRFALDKKYSQGDIISVAMKINAISFLILGVGIFLFERSGIIELETEMYVFLFAVFVSNSLNLAFTLYIKAKDKVTVLVVSSILNTLLMCLLNILFLLVFKWGVTGYMVSYALSSFVATGYMFFVGKIYKDFTFRTSKNTMKEMLLYSIPLILNPIAWWLNDAADKYILTFMCSVAVTGVYSVAYKIPTILYTVQGVFNNAWSISAIKEFDPEDSDGFVGNVFSLFSFVCVMAGSAMMLVNKPLSALLYSKDFFEAWKYVPFLLVAGVFSGLKDFLVNIFVASKKVKSIAITTLSGAAVNIICNFIFIRYIGPVGAALATVFGYIVMFIIRGILLRKIIKMKVNLVVIISSYCLLMLQAVIATKGDMLWLQIIIFVVLLLVQVKCLASFLKFIKERFLNKK